MAFTEQEQITREFRLFDEPISTVISSTRMSRDWPDARGIWTNSANNLIIWVNEEDHFRLVSMEKGANMRAVFDRLSKCLELFENALKSEGHSFMWNQHLGYLVTCPRNLGTCLRASMQVKLPLLCKHHAFEELLQNLRLEKISSNGNDTASLDEVYDISNKDRLKYSEVSKIINFNLPLFLEQLFYILIIKLSYCFSLYSCASSEMKFRNNLG